MRLLAVMAYSYFRFAGLYFNCFVFDSLHYHYERIDGNIWDIGLPLLTTQRARHAMCCIGHALLGGSLYACMTRSTARIQSQLLLTYECSLELARVLHAMAHVNTYVFTAVQQLVSSKL